MILLLVDSLWALSCWVVTLIDDSWDVAVPFSFDDFGSAPWIFCSVEAEDDDEEDGICDCCTMVCSGSFTSAPWIFCSLKDEDNGKDGICDTGLALLLRISF